MSPPILSAVVVLGLLSIVPVLWKLRVALRATTLTTAWIWLAATWCVWLVAWLRTAWPAGAGAGWTDQMWYAVGVLLLCPPIAVLGARRPTSRVWTWFVLLPLVLVFGWPAASAWGFLARDTAWVLEEPMLVGYLVVLVMGVGNYFGTVYFVPAMLYAIAAVCVTGPLCPALGVQPASAIIWRSAATLCVVAATWLAVWCGHRVAGAGAKQSPGDVPSGVSLRSNPGPTSLDRVWIDFCGTFGMVWSRRIQQRFNDMARQSNWGVQLTAGGFVNAADPTAPVDQLSPDARTAIEGALRWLLRRFVDPDWIDRRFDT